MAVSSTTGSAASTSASAVACSCYPLASSDSATAASTTGSADSTAAISSATSLIGRRHDDIRGTAPSNRHNYLHVCYVCWNEASLNSACVAVDSTANEKITTRIPPSHYYIHPTFVQHHLKSLQTTINVEKLNRT
ncbi:hypothetical protein PR001_g9719 [Phytophthora rubi]|uniref:Uncharacterized protein n=1 Tax=Phytophthora rubi TaxID=129364 RepID=A0A6A3MM57_9STRA|nr:hypothetical protein PR002_g9821 [Phytophthora rubi]KAE9034457.1 hypothetical protein PR001_g9719 [Phytophthora rubi]